MPEDFVASPHLMAIQTGIGDVQKQSLVTDHTRMNEHAGVDKTSQARAQQDTVHILDILSIYQQAGEHSSGAHNVTLTSSAHTT